MRGVFSPPATKFVHPNTFSIDIALFVAFLNTMSGFTTRWCWRKDLREFRGLSDQEKTGFLLVLEWFENFRLRYELDAGREAAKAFWRTEVLCEDREREPWQLEQWESAVRW
jgi:hypothetical protein